MDVILQDILCNIMFWVIKQIRLKTTLVANILLQQIRVALYHFYVFIENMIEAMISPAFLDCTQLVFPFVTVKVFIVFSCVLIRSVVIFFIIARVQYYKIELNIALAVLLELYYLASHRTHKQIYYINLKLPLIFPNLYDCLLYTSRCV